MNATHCLSPEEVLAGSLTSRAPAFLLGGGVSMLETSAGCGECWFARATQV